MNKTILDKVLDLKTKVSDTYNEVTTNTNNVATKTYNIIEKSTDTVSSLKNKVSVLSDMFTDLRVLNGTAKNIIYLSTIPVIENTGIKVLNDKFELDTTSKSYKEIDVRTSSITSLEKYTLTTTDKKKTEIDSFLRSGVDTVVNFPNNKYTFNLNLSYTSLEQINNIDIQLGLLTDSYPIINSIKYIDKDNVEQSVLILNNTSTSYDLDYNREQDNLYSIEISPILTDQIIIEFTSKTKSSITFKDIKTSFKKEVEQGTITLGPIHTNTPLLKIAIDTDDISTGSSFEFSSDLEYWLQLDSSSIITDQSNTKILSFNTINSNSIKSTEDLYTFYIRVTIASSVLTNSDTNISIYNTFRENNSMNNDTLDLVEDNLFSVYKVRNSDFIHGEYQYIESLNIKDFSLDSVEYLEVNGIPKVLGLVDTKYSITKNTTINSGGIGAELKYKRLPSENILEATSYDLANSKIYDIYEREIKERINIKEKENLCFSLKRKPIPPVKKPTEPVVISCEGSTNIVKISIANRIDSDGDWIKPTKQRIISDGVELDDINQVLEKVSINEITIPPPEGYTWIESSTFKNITNNNIKVQFITEPLNQNFTKIILEENPTAIEYYTNNLGVCLSPINREPRCYNYTQEEIQYLKNKSTGLTTKYSATYPIGDNYISINGQHIPTRTSENGQLILENNPYIELAFISNIGFYIKEHNNETTIIKICSAEPIPLEKSPFWDLENDDIIGAYKYFRDADGYETAVFVLNTKTKMSCEGALNYVDTGGIWGNYIVNVNGVDYYEPYGPELNEILYMENRGGELYWTWYNKTSDTLRVEMRNCTMYENDYGWGPEPEEGKEPNLTRVVNFQQKTLKFCLSPGTTCETIEADILPIQNNIQVGKYYINYRINNTEIKTKSYTVTREMSSYDLANNLFGEISDDQGWGLFILGGGSQAFGEDGEYHPAPFWSYLFKGTIAASEEIYSQPGEYINKPITIDFIISPGEGNDAVALYFGKDTTIKACSYRTWVAV